MILGSMEPIPIGQVITKPFVDHNGITRRQPSMILCKSTFEEFVEWWTYNYPGNEMMKKEFIPQKQWRYYYRV